MQAATNRSAARAGSLAAAAWLALACAGCASPTPGPAGAVADGAIDTGTFPNLNVPPPVATQPFDAASLQAHNSAIAGARSSQAQAGAGAQASLSASQAEQERLRKLAAAQQAATLKAIEGK